MSGFAVANDPPVECSRAIPLPARPDRLYHWVFLLCSLAIIVMAALLSVRGQTQVVLPILGVPLPELCMMRRTWGIDCPGCGMTRCFISLAHGRFADAWSFNPAGLLLFAIVFLQIPYRVVQLRRIARGLPELYASPIAASALVVFMIALVLQWTLRIAGIAF